MKAISLWNPWAFLIAVGAKRYETRSWMTPHRGPMAIHAGKRWTQRMARQCYEEPFFTILSSAGIRFPARLPSDPLILGFATGAVLAVADLVSVTRAENVLPQLGPQERAFGDFTHGRYAWQYENVVRLPKPVLCTGRQGLFDLPAEVEDRVRDQLRGVAAEGASR